MSKNNNTKQELNAAKARAATARIARQEESSRKEQGFLHSLHAKKEKANTYFGFTPYEKDKPKFYKFMRVLEDKAPKLIDSDAYLKTYKYISTIEHIRSIDDWEPNGKGRDRLFKSLCCHLLAKYPMPEFLWSGFFEEENVTDIAEIVSMIAGGESLFKLSKVGFFPVSLTRAQCHEFMNSHSDIGFMSALRRVQVKSEGGTLALHQALMRIRFGKMLDNPRTEEFKHTVIRFFSQNPMFDVNQIPPLIDYVTHKFNNDKTFSMKGRSVQALQRGMHEWHGELAEKKKVLLDVPFKRSGIKEAEYIIQKRVNGNFIHNEWSIKEILSSKLLHEEGKALSHCVYSYSGRVQSGHTSIWSLRHFESRMITLEVNNSNKSIVQARGKFNRRMTSEEDKVVARWARESGLSLKLDTW